eukprot:GFYU01018710.1.p2 GENE.GFYU01018710.1~~GFYU01018710.1.p2  ORF type:complete len:159 (-),score=9.35 GFYU01018710.1:213-689(-)
MSGNSPTGPPPGRSLPTCTTPTAGEGDDLLLAAFSDLSAPLVLRNCLDDNCSAMEKSRNEPAKFSSRNSALLFVISLTCGRTSEVLSFLDFATCCLVVLQLSTGDNLRLRLAAGGATWSDGGCANSRTFILSLHCQTRCVTAESPEYTKCRRRPPTSN